MESSVASLSTGEEVKPYKIHVRSSVFIGGEGIEGKLICVTGLVQIPRSHEEET